MNTSVAIKADYILGLIQGMLQWKAESHDAYVCTRPSDFQVYSRPSYVEGYWDAIPWDEMVYSDIPDSDLARVKLCRLDALPYSDHLHECAERGLDTIAHVRRQLGQEADG